MTNKLNNTNNANKQAANTDLQKVLNKALGFVKPNKQFEKRLLAKCNTFLNILSRTARNLGLTIDFEIGGSVAKGTFLKKLQDVDVFAAFELKTARSQNISLIVEQVLKASKLEYERVHGSRDYFVVMFKALRFEIVPVVRVKTWRQALNMTDVSLLHVSWIKRHLRKNHKLADDIRLAKQFCKACKCYGAESFVKGFSGHLLDILVVYYKGFTSLLKNALQWKPFETIIDPDNNYEQYLKVEDKRPRTALVVIEPVHAQRNAAAALSLEKLERFKQKAKSFLKHPSIKFFVVKPLSLNEFIKEHKLKNSSVKIIELDIKALSGNPDVSGAKVLKIYEHIIKKLKLHDFKLLANDWEFFKNKSRAIMFFALASKELSRTVVVKGPPVKALKHVERFKQKHPSKAFEKLGRLYAIVHRDFTKPEQLIKYLIKRDYVTSRCSNIKLKIHKNI